MLKKIKRAFGFGSCDPMEGSTIIINAEKLERRVALLENGVLEEYTIEREGEDNIVGGIFKGRVKNIEPGLKAMFVDIGQEKKRLSALLGRASRCTGLQPGRNRTRRPSEKTAAQNHVQRHPGHLSHRL